MKTQTNASASSGGQPRVKLSLVRRGLTILTVALTIGSILILAGTAFTANRFAVHSVVAPPPTVSPEGYTFEATFDLRNAGLFDVAIHIDGRILSGEDLVAESPVDWTVAPASAGNFTYTIFVDNATAAIYFTPLRPQPVFDFVIGVATAYGFVSLTVTGSREINF